ncbi:COG1361 S-layer family protein, partial [Candidatus Woesearchaeota archaeon]|nr:COG1361 S-layer family protein [Candidatus Woesearchaeota archaeon]
VQAAYSFGPNIEATLLSQQPDPVKPGEIVEVRFKIENSGTAATSEILVEIMPEFPFSLYSGEAVVNVGKMRAGQTGADASIVAFKLKVDEKAVEGDNEIELRVKIADDVWKSYTEENFMVRVESPDSILSLEGIYTQPEQMVPGQDAKLYIKLNNQADNILRNIKLSLDLDDVPIVPTDSSDEKSVYQIKAGEEEWVVFNLVAEADAEAKIYKVPVDLTYYDVAGNLYSKETTIGLKIGDEPELLLYISETEVYAKGQKGAVTITIANHGLANVKLMKMTLMPSENYEVISANEVYIGDVDTDDIESQDFDVYVSKGKETVDLLVKLEYRDANNKKITENYQVPLKLYSSWEARKFGLKKSSSWVWLIVLVILGVVGYFLYHRYWRKKKKNNKQ